MVAPPGVGKTTTAQQVVLHRVGVRSGELLGLDVEQSTGQTLYLAMDRPSQIARSMRRGISEGDRDLLNDRIVVWKGPPPYEALPDSGPEGPSAFAAWVKSLGNIDTVVIDSLKDICMSLEKPESGSSVNSALQHLMVAGIEALVLHHQRKASGDNKKPKALSDVYGSAWLTAGAGSVILLWGEAGDAVVEMNHLKQPAEDVGPFTLLHDHEVLNTELYEPENATVERILPRYVEGISVKKMASVLNDKAEPDRNMIEKARRKLDAMVKDGRALALPGKNAKDPTLYTVKGGSSHELTPS